MNLDDDSGVSSGSWLSPPHVLVFSSLKEVEVTGESSSVMGATTIKRSCEELRPKTGSLWNSIGSQVS
jgi:hypothetical protein